MQITYSNTERLQQQDPYAAPTPQHYSDYWKVIGKYTRQWKCPPPIITRDILHSVVIDECFPPYSKQWYKKTTNYKESGKTSREIDKVHFKYVRKVHICCTRRPTTVDCHLYQLNKLTEWGFKLLAACDSKTVIPWNFEIYSGQDNAAGGLAHDVVIHLTRPLENNCTVIFTDNFYTSAKPAQSLRQNTHHLVRTIRTNQSPWFSHSNLMEAEI